MRYILFILFSISLFNCSEYQKALKSTNTAEKFNLGTSLYDAEKYAKANRLFAQIVPVYRGKPQAEKLMFMYSSSLYKMGDFYLSGYQFDNFTSTYVNSQKLEEASFLGAKSYYELSPIYSKDQTETVTAIEKLQLFINQFPDSKYLAEANTLIQELDFKLEKKAFEIAKQFNYTAYYDTSDYEAAISSFDNFIVDFPGSELREDAMYLRLDSAYKLAVNSIESKKQSRLNTALDYYRVLIEAYPETKFFDEIQKMNAEMLLALEQINLKANT